MTRVVEKVVERVVTRIVVETIDAVEEQTPDVTPSDSATPVSTSRNLAPSGSAFVSSGEDSARQAIDDDIESAWNSQLFPIQWFMVTLDDLYLVDRVEMVITQSPAGQTMHEIWLGDASGVRTLYKQLIDVHTEDGQTLEVAIEPPRVINEVLIRTTNSPSHVAWREVRVFGQLPISSEVAGAAPDAISRQWINWPEIKMTASLALPVQVTNAGDSSGRIFVVEQEGRIMIIKNGVILKTPFLDISDRVGCCGERGLLNVAFPPAYATKQHFYVNYTNTAGNTIVARYRVTDDVDLADPESEEIVLTIEQPDQIHNGGPNGLRA